MIRTASRNLLALDTSTRSVGLALYGYTTAQEGVQVKCEFTWTSRDYHTIELAPAIAEALRKTGITAHNLDAIGVALGPGSFTGLRIGLALAKGLALPQRLPLIGIPTLDILAASQPLSELQLVAVLRAGRGRLAAGWYRAGSGGWVAAQSSEVLTPEALAERITSQGQPTLVCGELTAEERELLKSRQPLVSLASPAAGVRRPAYLAELAWKRWQAGQVDDPATLAPIYLHYPDNASSLSGDRPTPVEAAPLGGRPALSIPG